MLLVVSFISLYMCLRGRRRKQVALARKVSRVYPGGNMSMDCDPKPQAHMSFHEQGWPIGRQHTTLSRPGQFSPGPRTMGGKTHTGRHGKYSRLSWSVRPRKSTSLRLPAHDGRRFALSPVIESPLSRSMSSPELSSGVGFGFSMPKSPLIHSESVAQPAVYWQTTITALAKSSPTSPQTIWEAFCVNSFPSPDLSGNTDARPSPKLRSVSENFLPSGPVPDHEVQRTASSGTFRTAKSRPLSAQPR